MKINNFKSNCKKCLALLLSGICVLVPTLKKVEAKTEIKKGPSKVAYDKAPELKGYPQAGDDLVAVMPEELDMEKILQKRKEKKKNEI